MKKKKSSGGGANWMDTYGDMVTLLLCFFVLLYSMSTISEENWKKIVQSFNPSGIPTQIEDIKGGNGPSADDDKGGIVPGTDAEQGKNPTQKDINEVIEDLLQSLQSFAAQAGVSESVSVYQDASGRIYVTFKDTAFFDANKYYIRQDAQPILDDMCEMLTKAAQAIQSVRIQGHTAQARADQPNTSRGDRFLSSNRATEVLVYIQEHTDWNVLDPAKLVSEGMGQWHPVSGNDTNEQRAKNRRVEIIISGRNLEEELSGGIQNYTTGESYTTEPTESAGEQT